MVIDGLCAATNAHDLEAVTACFSPDYRNETPVHPSRGFTGREQVRHNWRQIFRAVPDVRAKVLRSCVEENTVWSEWEHSGTRPDGSSHSMRGVIIFGVRDGLISWSRFYLEPVDADPSGVDAAVRRHVGGAA
jgi:ketosteroid isomerase-like protein